MSTKREIREQLREWWGRMAYYPKTNETYFPAAWAGYKGHGPDTTTSRPYDCRMSLLIERAERYYGKRFRSATRTELVEAIYACEHADATA